jgi:F-box protein 11
MVNFTNKIKGILAIKDSRPFMVDNRISHNQNIGLYIRDKSHGRII